NLTLVHPKNVMQAADTVAMLTSDHSPLLQLLETIKQNTSFAPIKAASPKLQNLSVLLADANNSSSALYHIFMSLQSLNIYLQGIMHATDVPAAIYSASAMRMQTTSTSDPINSVLNSAEQSPEPLKTWLNQIAMDSWACMLKDTAFYIENIWQKTILSFYRVSIANRYPFA